mgnify:FL=1
MAVHENTLLMLKRRGYNTTITDRGDSYFRIQDALVVFVKDEKVSINHMKHIISLRIDSENIINKHGKTITSESKNMIAASINIEPFTFDEMGYDILEIIPHHSKVDEPKHKEWKKFPILKSTDPACRYFGFNKGDVVRIQDGDELIYRRVL